MTLFSAINFEASKIGKCADTTNARVSHKEVN